MGITREMEAVQNPNPQVFEVKPEWTPTQNVMDQNSSDPWESGEIFDIIRKINDPEHPLTLEQLNVIQEDLISVDDKNNSIQIFFTPTIPHCSMATLIGLSLRVKLIRSLPTRFKVDILITPGSHMSEDAIDRQLNDKER